MEHSAKFIKRLCKQLVAQGNLSEKEIEPLVQAFTERSDIGFEYFLLEQGLITRPDILNALSAVYNLPAMDVEGVLFDHFLVRMFPKDEMLRELFIPFERDGDTLVVIAAHPDNDNLISIIGNYTEYDIMFYVGLARDITDMVSEYYDTPLEQYDIENDEIIEDNDSGVVERCEGDVINENYEIQDDIEDIENS